MKQHPIRLIIVDNHQMGYEGWRVTHTRVKRIRRQEGLKGTMERCNRATAKFDTTTSMATLAHTA